MYALDRTPPGKDPGLIKVNVHVKLPPEVARLAEHLEPGLETLLRAAWLEGIQTAAIVLVPVIVCLLFRRKGQP